MNPCRPVQLESLDHQRNVQCVAIAAVEDADMRALFSAAPHCCPRVIFYPLMHLTKLKLRDVHESERLIFYSPLGRILRQH